MIGSTKFILIRLKGNSRYETRAEGGGRVLVSFLLPQASPDSISRNLKLTGSLIIDANVERLARQKLTTPPKRVTILYSLILLFNGMSHYGNYPGKTLYLGSRAASPERNAPRPRLRAQENLASATQAPDG